MMHLLYARLAADGIGVTDERVTSQMVDKGQSRLDGVIVLEMQ